MTTRTAHASPDIDGNASTETAATGGHVAWVPVENVGERGRTRLTEDVACVTVDDVNHPTHYTSGEIECIDAIEAALSPEAFVGFCKGNAMKYIWRAGLKDDAAKDLRKAVWYLDRAAVALDD